MRYIAWTMLGAAALIFAAAPTYTYAEGTTGQSTGEKIGQKAKSTAKDAKTQVTDSWITAKTKIALFADERVKGRQVSVETTGGTVWLRGKVDSEHAKMAATDIVKGVEHVKSVRNELQVVPVAERTRVDTDDKVISEMVEQRLMTDPHLNSAKISARVDAGIVTLTGEVRSLMVSSRASEVLSDVPGVRAVRNDLRFEPRSSMVQQ
jgi:hyperosmotically inducible periplasmic protein